MIAAAVAQVVVGNNNTQQETSGTSPTGNNIPMHQNSLVLNHLNERRCSGPEASSIMTPENNVTNVPNENNLNGNNHSPGALSESTSNVNKNPHPTIPIKNGVNDHPSTSRFLSDGISQLTMGSFQV